MKKIPCSPTLYLLARFECCRTANATSPLATLLLFSYPPLPALFYFAFSISPSALFPASGFCLTSVPTIDGSSGLFVFFASPPHPIPLNLSFAGNTHAYTPPSRPKIPQRRNTPAQFSIWPRNHILRIPIPLIFRFRTHAKIFPSWRQAAHTPQHRRNGVLFPSFPPSHLLVQSLAVLYRITTDDLPLHSTKKPTQLAKRIEDNNGQPLPSGHLQDASCQEHLEEGTTIMGKGGREGQKHTPSNPHSHERPGPLLQKATQRYRDTVETPDLSVRRGRYTYHSAGFWFVVELRQKSRIHIAQLGKKGPTAA